MTEIINNEKLKLYWKKYLKDEITESEFNKKTFNSESQKLIIDDHELSLKDLPADNSIVQKFEHFALTFPVSRYFNPYINYLPNIYREYSEEGKRKESIRNLRGCMFFSSKKRSFYDRLAKIKD